MTLNYTMIPGELRIQPPEIVIRELSIIQENNPHRFYSVLANGEQSSGYTEQFKFHFHCKTQDKEGWLDIDFDFYEDEPIGLDEYTWVQAAEKWLFPFLNQVLNEPAI